MKSQTLLGALTMVALAAIGCTCSRSPSVTPREHAKLTRRQTGSAIQTVFIVLMENHDWRQILGNPSARYINDTLLPQSSYTTQYFNPPGIHPSLPNYLWLEAGTNFGIRDDGLPAVHHQSTSKHFATLLEAAGYPWKTYQEGIDDVRPYEELAGDLASGNLAQYIFITSDQCHDMHDSSGCETPDSVRNGDLWLSREMPQILASDYFNAGGALFITWDEGIGTSDGPIGTIVLSPLAKGKGYNNKTYYSHSSTLRTFQEIFGVKPLLGDAANAKSLSDLFNVYP